MKVRFLHWGYSKVKECKRLKDPIYGYISIPSSFMHEIIDTASFQRLRRIIQTSYSPLYSSAVHNRFVHSIGVFHLGKIASKQVIEELLKKNIGGFNKEELVKLEKIFLLACLLHDVGHAPFSHTGEAFYLDEKKEYTLIHKKLIEMVGVKSFEKDVPLEKISAAAPHEIMSSIVGITEFEDFFESESEKDFFARCITGYRYSEKNIQNDIKNCFIQLLNSKIIDVDKLDYLIRDAYITGFDTVNIDYERLLNALTVVINGDKLELAYYKNAVSVIENVVYAHDAERKWIQSHPIVIYETYILQHIIGNLCEKMEESGNKLFSLESLGYRGQDFAENIRIRFMSDDDIIYLMKNVYPSDLTEEYLDRRYRRHPVWKSEAEYKAVFIGFIKGGILLTEFEKAMEATAKYLRGRSDIWNIDKKLIEVIKNELEEIETADLDAVSKKAQKQDKEMILKVITCLQEYAEKKKLDFDFIIIQASQFNSGFGKPDFSDINIAFPTLQGEELVAKVGDIVTSLKAKDKERDNFFYLFYKRNEKNSVEIDSQELRQILIREFLSS